MTKVEEGRREEVKTSREAKVMVREILETIAQDIAYTGQDERGSVPEGRMAIAR